MVVSALAKTNVPMGVVPVVKKIALLDVRGLVEIHALIVALQDAMANALLALVRDVRVLVGLVVKKRVNVLVLILQIRHVKGGIKNG